MSLVYIRNYSENTFPIAQNDYRTKSLRVTKTVSYSFTGDYKKIGYIGPPPKDPPNPKNFLRKHSRDLRRPPVEPGARERSVSKKAPIPTYQELMEDERKRKAMREKPKNFVLENVKNVKNARPPSRATRSIFIRFGEAYVVDPSKFRQISFLKNYTKLPIQLLRYLRRTNYNSCKEGEEEYLPNCRFVSRKERQDLYNGLYQTFRNTLQEFQTLPITDNIQQLFYKNKLEGELKDLEKDINLVEKHPLIYTYDESHL